MNKYKSKHTLSQIQGMRDLVKDGYAVQYVARKFKCRPNAVLHHIYDLILPRKVSKEKQERYLLSSNLTIAKVQQIRKFAVKQGISALELSRRYNISPTAALSIVNGKTFRWLAGLTKKGYIEPIEYENIQLKTDRKRGAKKGSKHKVKFGVLIKYAEIHGVKPTTICRWIKKGEFKVKKNERV